MFTWSEINELEIATMRSTTIRRCLCTKKDNSRAFALVKGDARVHKVKRYNGIYRDCRIG